MINDWESFFTTIRRMRQAQKQYFRTRERSDLMTSKALEKEVDEAIYTREHKNDPVPKELF